MKPGKIFRPYDLSVRIWPYPRESGKYGLSHLFNNEVFIVIAVELNQEQKKLANEFNVISPWVVLFKEKVWLADIHNRKLMDLTPWAPWDPQYEHNQDLIKDFKHYVR